MRVLDVSINAGAPAAPAMGRVRGLWRRVPTIVRYGLTGGVTQCIYLTTMAALLSADVDYMLALCGAQAAAIVFAFPAYRNVVFMAEGPLARQVGAFLGVWWTGAALSVIGVPVLVEMLGLAPLVAQVTVLSVVVVMSFLGHRNLTFGHPGR